MPFDYKKEYKEFYLPPKTPQIVETPTRRAEPTRRPSASCTPWPTPSK